MVDTHRKVEAHSIIGTGMTADPERIEEMVAEAERRERANPPKKDFGKIIKAIVASLPRHLR